MAVGDAFKAAIVKAGLDAARESAERLRASLDAAAAAADKIKAPAALPSSSTSEVDRLTAAYNALAGAEAKAAAGAMTVGQAAVAARSPWATRAPGSGSGPISPKMPAGKGGVSDSAKGAADAAGKAPGEAGNSAFKAPKDLKYILKHAGIGKAAMGAMGAAAGLELTKLALGYRGMAMLGAVTQRTGMQIRSLFSGVNPMPAVRAFDTLANQIFNKAGPAGKALGSIFEHTFNGLFGALEKAEPYVQAFFEGAIVGALKMETAYYQLRLAALPLTDAISEAIGPMMSFESAAIAGGVALGGLALYAAAAAAPFAPLLAAIAAVSKALEQLAKLQKEVQGAGGWGQAAKDMGRHFVEGTGKNGEDQVAARARAAFDRSEEARRVAAQAPGGAGAAPAPGGAATGPAGMATGKAYADGMAKGVAAGQPAVDAAGSAAAAGLDASARGALKIKSPSKVGEETGGQYPAGIARGVERRAPEAQEAMRDAATAPKVDGSTATGATAGASFPAEALALLRRIAENTRPRLRGAQRGPGWGQAVHTIASVLGVDHGLAGA